jgi:hypothetical protein
MACTRQHVMKPKRLALTEPQISGEDPAAKAWEVLFADSQKLKGKQLIEHIRQLPQHWRAVYTTIKLDCEVNNGGHHQFFWNS